MSDDAHAEASRDMNPEANRVSILNRFPEITGLEIADTFWKRALGLIGKPGLGQGRGLLLPRCRSIHTGFMRFTIDVIFLDRDNGVVKIVQGVKPWRMARGGRNAVSTLEIESGWLPLPSPQNKLKKDTINAIVQPSCIKGTHKGNQNYKKEME